MRKLHVHGRRAAIVAGLALFVAILAWFHDSPILLQYQGVQMVRAAHSLTTGAGFELPSGVPFARWPPLYPVLLSLSERAGLGVIPAAYLINALTLVISLIGLYALGRVLGLRRVWPVVLFYGSWAANWYLLRAVRPDAIPIGLSILCIWFLAVYFVRPRWSMLLLLASFCLLATLARYMPVFTLLPVVGVGVLTARHSTRWRRLCHAGVFCIVSTVPIGLWLLRNQRLTGYLTGMSRTAPRKWAEEHTLLENVVLTLKTMALDAFSYVSIGVRLLDDSRHPYFSWVVAGASIVLALVAVGFWVDRRAVLAVVGSRLREMDASAVALIASASYVAIYLAATWTLWTLGNSDPINTRYVAPIYPFLFVIAFWLHSNLKQQRIAPKLRIALLALGVLTLLPNLYKSTRLMQDSPGVYLTEVRNYATRSGTWRRNVEWARPVTPPVVRADSVPD